MGIGRTSRHVATAAALALALAAGAPSPAPAQEAAEALEGLLAGHAACARAGEDSGVCSGILTTHCLGTGGDMDGLTACRAAVARALEAEAAELTEALAARGARARAAEIAAGAERVVADFCAALGAKTAAPAARAHDIRCAMMRAHVTVYHLIRALAETEETA